MISAVRRLTHRRGGLTQHGQAAGTARRGHAGAGRYSDGVPAGARSRLTIFFEGGARRQLLLVQQPTRAHTPIMSEPTQPSSSTLVASDLGLIQMNRDILSALKAYVSMVPTQIRFGMPEKDKPPSDPAVYVFLYDLQEDLELRHGQVRGYDALTGRLERGYVNVRCCYLIMYWDKAQAEPDFAPDSHGMTIMNQVLNALLNIRTTVKYGFSRVIAPSEHLSGLGNFWQSLGDKPRLCLNYTVTIPVPLTAPAQPSVEPVLTVAVSEPSAQEYARPPLEQALRRALLSQVKTDHPDHADSTQWAQLERLTLTCSLDASGPVKVSVAGMLGAVLHDQVISVVKAWKGQAVAQVLKPVLTTLPAPAWASGTISDVDHTRLQPVTLPRP